MVDGPVAGNAIVVAVVPVRVVDVRTLRFYCLLSETVQTELVIYYERSVAERRVAVVAGIVVDGSLLLCLLIAVRFVAAAVHMVHRLVQPVEPYTPKRLASELDDTAAAFAVQWQRSLPAVVRNYSKESRAVCKSLKF